MGKFALGVVVTLLVLVLGGLGFAMLGFFPTACQRRAPAPRSVISPWAPWTPPWSATPLASTIR